MRCRAKVGQVWCEEESEGEARVGPILGVEVIVPLCQLHMHVFASGVLPLPVCADCRRRLTVPGE